MKYPLLIGLKWTYWCIIIYVVTPLKGWVVNFEKQGPAWRYHSDPAGEKRPRGRTLRLLSFEEIKNKQILDLLESYFRDYSRRKSHKVEYFPLFIQSHSHEHEALSQYRRFKSELARRTVFIEERDGYAVAALNQALNRIFSDAGWKAMRKRITQLAKFKANARPLISQASHQALIEFRDAHHLGSLDEAIQQLLAAHQRLSNSEEDKQ